RRLTVRREAEPEREWLAAAADLSDPGHFLPSGKDLPAERAGRLSDHLQDHRQQHAWVVRGRERVADERQGFARIAVLGRGGPAPVAPRRLRRCATAAKVPEEQNDGRDRREQSKREE